MTSIKKNIQRAFLLVLVSFAFNANAQSVAINTDGSTADPSAILDLKSTNQGVLVPRLTQAQRALINAPATGLMVYQTDATAGFYFYNGSAWTSLSATGAQGPQGIQGEVGPQGPSGPQGIAGTNGTNGNDGAVGASGPQGIQGLTGATGVQGPIGLTGATGAQGIAGTNGAAGATGAQGPQGLTGVTGAAGQGVPTGGTANQVLAKINGSDFNTQWITPSGGGANLQLIANKVNGSAETLPLAGSTNPTTIVFNNVISTPSLGTYNNGTGIFTVGTSGAGTYLVQVKLLCNDANPVNQTLAPFLTLIKNNATYGSTGADIFYGDYPGLQASLPTGLRGQGSLTKVVQLASGDTLRIVAVGANSGTAAQPTSTVAGSNITIIKL